MVRAFNQLNLVRKVCPAHPLVIKIDRSGPIGNALLHLKYYVQALDWLVLLFILQARVISDREHVQIHPILYSFSMENTTRPIAYNLIIVAHVLLGGLSEEATLAFFVDEASFLILNHFAPKN